MKKIMRKVVTTKTCFALISTDQFSLEINTLQIELFKRLLKEDMQKMHNKNLYSTNLLNRGFSITKTVPKIPTIVKEGTKIPKKMPIPIPITIRLIKLSLLSLSTMLFIYFLYSLSYMASILHKFIAFCQKISTYQKHLFTMRIHCFVFIFVR